MKISLFQQDIAWLDPSANYQKIERVLQDSPDTDLLVLPEMCTTGFITLPTEGQLESATDVEQRLLALAQKYDTALCGSFAVSDETLPSTPQRANRCYFVTPEGDIHHYDKHHLYTPGGEGLGYCAGQKKVMVSWRGIRFLLTVCYDLRFPLWLRYDHEHPYDILICVANWPEQRQLAWDTLLRARAIENQAFVIGINRIGQDQMCSYQGGTCAIHPYGHYLAQCTLGQEGVCSFEPDMQKLNEFRQKFPVLSDADTDK